MGKSATHGVRGVHILRNPGRGLQSSFPAHLRRIHAGQCGEVFDELTPRLPRDVPVEGTQSCLSLRQGHGGQGDLSVMFGFFFRERSRQGTLVKVAPCLHVPPKSTLLNLFIIIRRTFDPSLLCLLNAYS